MKKLDVTGIALLLIGTLLFLSTYYYHQQVYRHDYRYTGIVTSITTAFRAKEMKQGPYMSSERSVVTEEQGILLAFVISAIFASTPLLTTYLSKRLHGSKAHHLPVSFAAVVTVLWVLYVTNSIGLFAHA